MPGLPRRNKILLRSAGAQGQKQCVRPLGKVPTLGIEPAIKNPSGVPGSCGILGLRPGVGSVIRFQGQMTATWVRHGEGPRETGQAILVRTVPGSLSGRATPRVPSLSNSRSRRSQDLGVKVRRKKKLSCINVPMGGTTAPSHSLLTPPAWRRPIKIHRPPSPSCYRANENRRGATPRGSETLPFSPPHPFCVQWGCQEGWADAAPDQPPRPPTRSQSHS